MIHADRNGSVTQSAEDIACAVIRLVLGLLLLLGLRMVLGMRVVLGLRMVLGLRRNRFRVREQAESLPEFSRWQVR